MSNINIGKRINCNAVDDNYNIFPNIDYKYGPYKSIADALSAIDSLSRSIGLTVGILENNGITEYWFKKGITDSDLVNKNADSYSLTTLPIDYLYPNLTTFYTLNTALQTIPDRLKIINQSIVFCTSAMTIECYNFVSNNIADWNNIDYWKKVPSDKNIQDINAQIAEIEHYITAVNSGILGSFSFVDKLPTPGVSGFYILTSPINYSDNYTTLVGTAGDFLLVMYKDNSYTYSIISSNSNNVTLNTNQDVTGIKTFKNGIKIEKGIETDTINATGTSTLKEVDSDLVKAKEVDANKVVSDDIISKTVKTDDLDVVKLAILEKGFKTPDYDAGKAGAFLGVDSNGKIYLEVDKLLVRIKAYFESLEIKKVDYVGGTEVISPAGGIKCTKVEEQSDSYRCYFCGDDGDIHVNNYFAQFDLAIAKDFNIKPGVYKNVTNTYYWRTVINVGDNYIDLSKTDCDSNSDIPKAGDKICHLGNKQDEERQAAIILSAVDASAPSITLYAGINSFSLQGKEYIQMGYDATAKKAFHNVYGNAYIGDRNGNNYIRLKDDVLEICAKLISKATGKDIDDTIAIMNSTITDVKAQSDKQFVIWFGTDIPTTTTEPASNWNTDDLKKQHVDDWFFIKTDNAAGGKAYRYELGSNGYGWANITDSDTIAALNKASDAFTNANQAKSVADDAHVIANSKMRVFVATPIPPYSIGDMWSNANYMDNTNTVLYTNDLLTCKVAKAADGIFDITDWQPANNATTATLKNLGDAIEARVKNSDFETLLEQKSNSIKAIVYGKAEDGTTNNIITSINLDTNGIKILAKQLDINATVLANLIMATGLKVGVKDAQGNFTSINFEVKPDGTVNTKDINAEGIIKAKLLYTSFKNITSSDFYVLNPTVDGCSVYLGGDTDSMGHGYNSNLLLPSAQTWDGLHILVNVNNLFSSTKSIIKTTDGFIFPHNGTPVSDVLDTNLLIHPDKGLYEFISVGGKWLITNYNISIGPFIHTGIKDDSSTTLYLSENITYVSCYNTVEKIVKLPLNPIPFKEIVIYRGGDGNLIIDGNGKQMLAAGSLQNTVNLAHKSERDTVTYNGVNWDYSYGNYN